MLRSAGRKWARTGVQRMGRRIKGAQLQQVGHCHIGPLGEFELRDFIILDPPRSPMRRPDSRFWQGVGKVGPLARPSAFSRRAELLQFENHYCNNVLRSP